MKQQRGLLSGPWSALATLMLGLIVPTEISAQQLAAATPTKDDELWQRTVDLVRQGEFTRASALVDTLPHGSLTDKVRSWLTQYQETQTSRRELNRADFDLFVGYAKARYERKEYALALEKAVRAADNAENRDLFVKEPWLESVIKDALTEADGFRKASQWEDAWEIYYYLGLLFENHEGYQKLERECINHLRLERIFEKDNKWEEPLRDIRWDMASKTLDFLAKYYVDEKLDFKKLTQAGLEQLLLLTESKSAQARFEGLGDETLRTECQERLRERLRQASQAASLDSRAAAEYFSRALHIVQTTVKLPENLIVSELMRGGLENVDDFTSNIWPADWDEFKKHTEGDFIGVGISIVKNSKGQVEVVSPLEDTPAFRAGVQPGDLILKVNDADLSEMSINRVVDTITGPKDSEVTLGMRRGTKDFDLTLKRELVVIHTVKGFSRDPQDPQKWNFWADKEQGIAIVRVNSFAKNTVAELEGVLSQLKTEGMKGLMLDLRGNPGGLLDAAEAMASLFLPSGARVHSINGRYTRDNKLYDVPAAGAFRDVPMAVLTDGNSASASEIVAGALRDNKRALVIGERTYGKFSVQNLIPINPMPPAALKITTAHYYLPSGVSLHRQPGAKTWGVEPNISVPLVTNERFKAYQMRRKADVIGVAKDEEDFDKLPAPDADVSEKKDDAPAHPAQQLESGEGGAEAGHPKAEDGATAGLKEGETTGEPQTEGAEPTEAKADAKPKLPPLEQPAKNNRPEVDPQFDTALMIMRITLLGQSFPTLATANVPASGTRHE
ncbi:MAG: S41 family peptidase [Phycisphaerales bacterium]|nr:S41 family peptidase [Phycisphaerales bacterium]